VKNYHPCENFDTSMSRVDQVFLYYPNVFLHCVSLRFSSRR